MEPKSDEHRKDSIRAANTLVRLSPHPRVLHPLILRACPQHNLVLILERILSELLIQKPSNPKQFLAQRLESIKVSKKLNFWSVEELESLFSKFDLTGKGSMSVAQCNQALKMLVGSNADVRDAQLGGVHCAPVDKKQFVEYMMKALAKVESQ